MIRCRLMVCLTLACGVGACTRYFSPNKDTTAVDGFRSDGLPSDGLPPDGLRSDGLPPDGLPPDGLPSDATTDAPLLDRGPALEGMNDTQDRRDSGGQPDLDQTPAADHTFSPTGPFSGLGLPPFGSLGPPLILSGEVNGGASSRTSPLSASKVTVDGTVSIRTGTQPAFFVRADEVHFTNHGRLIATGQTSRDGFGGEGGSGGGAPAGCGGVPGVGGSSGGSGLPASGGTCMGSVGRGWGQTYATGYADYGRGGDGGPGTSMGFGLGGNGSGGGGGGAPDRRGGGGGGGGLIVIDAQRITGTGLLVAEGGMGRDGFAINSPHAPGGGGGGVIWVAAAEYRGNLQVSVEGGRSRIGAQYDGKIGTARIFQRLPSGRLVQRSFADRWRQNGTFEGASALPFPETLPPTDQMANATITSTSRDGRQFVRVQPYSGNQVTINGTLSYTSTGPTAVFVRARELLFTGGVIAANGQTGDNRGGDGGNGGGGSAACGTSGQLPMAGSGRAGVRGGGSCGREGGAGWAAFYTGGFDFGSGGDGGSGLVAGGAASNGAGGGGAPANEDYGGGGGGGGLVAIVANSISGPGRIEAKGGNRGETLRQAGGGGGGVVWIAAGSYDGQLTADVSPGLGNGPISAKPGTVRIYQIMPSGTLVPRSLRDTW